MNQWLTVFYVFFYVGNPNAFIQGVHLSQNIQLTIDLYGVNKFLNIAYTTHLSIYSVN